MKATFPLPPRLLHRHRLLKCVQWNQHLPIGTMNFTRSNIVNNLCFNQLISGDCGNKGKLLPCTVADLTGREGTVRNWMRWTILISISKSGKCLGRFHVNFILRLRGINMTPPPPHWVRLFHAHFVSNVTNCTDKFTPMFTHFQQNPRRVTFSWANSLELRMCVFVQFLVR